MTRILITGANGFLGAALARRFETRQGVELFPTGRVASPPFTNGRALDLHDPEALALQLGEVRPDIVIHAAGRTPGKPGDLLADNAIATANLTAAIGRHAPGAAMILLGSAAQYGVSEDRRPWRESDPCAPFEPYGVSKQVAEQAAFADAAQRGGRVTALRLFNVIAPEPQGEQVFAHFLRKAAIAAAGRPPWVVPMGPLMALRDFVDVSDVLLAAERVIERDVWGEVINVATGVGRTARALLGAAAAQTGGAVVIEEAPPDAMQLAWSVGDPSRCEALLGFRPSSDLAPITRRAAEWLMAAAKGGVDARSPA